MITLYGLKNCDSCRNALNFLKARDLEHRFHDLRADGLREADLDNWLGHLGWQQVVNRRSTTWRGLPEEAKADLDEAGARQLLLEHPTLVKRPVIELAGTLIVGFAAPQQAALASALAGIPTDSMGRSA